MPSDTPPLEDAPRRDGSQVQFVWDALQRHWTFILVFLWAGAGIGLVTGFLLHDEQRDYTASATLIVKPSLYDHAWMESLGGNLFGPLTPRSVQERISLSALADDTARAIAQSDLAHGNGFSLLTTDDEFAGLAKHLEALISIDVPEASAALTLNAHGQTPAEAEQLAEIASRVLIEQAQQVALNEQAAAHEIVRTELDELRRQLDEAENAQWVFREAIGIQTHDQVWSELEQKDAALRETLATRDETLAKIEELDAALAQNREELPESLGNVSASAVEKLKDELDVLLAEKAEMKVIYAADAPVSTPLEELNALIADKREAILIAIRELGGGADQGLGSWEQQKDLYAKKAAIEFELSDLDIRAGSLQKVIDELEGQLPALAGKRLEYQQLIHTTEQVRQQFNRMLEKESELKTALGRAAATLERRDPVVVFPSGNTNGSPIWITALMGTAIGLIVAFALAMLIESLDTSIRSPEDAAQHIHLDVLGTIPRMKFGKHRIPGRRRANAVNANEEQIDACIVTRYDPKSPISEAYRSLRTNFQFATLSKKPSTVMVTSAVPGEGKTTTAVNFAVTMADQGMRVLVVDTDLRRPHVHRVLKMERGKGLADVLRERIPIKDVVRPTKVENLWMISSGRVPPNPSELVGSDSMKALIEEFGKSFDLVVCDAPSLHVVTDPVLLATQVDTVLLVISVNNARRETIIRAKKFLETANPHIAGVVLNGLETTRRHYYYYYYYYENQRAVHNRMAWFQRL